MKTIENKVLEEANYCVDILADFLKVEIKERPKIVYRERDISGYNFEENKIDISKKVGFEFIFNDVVGKGKDFLNFLNKITVYSRNLKENEENYEDMLLTYNKLKKFSDKYPQILNKIKKEMKKSYEGGRNLTQDLYDHLIGYSVAEQFIKNNPDFMERTQFIFRQTDKFVFDNYFLKDYMKPYYKLSTSILLKKYLDIKKNK